MSILNEEKMDKCHMIDDLANSIKNLGVRPEALQPEMAKKYDDTIRRMLDKINTLLEGV